MITRTAYSVRHLREMLEGYRLLFGDAPSEILVAGTFEDTKSGDLLFARDRAAVCLAVGRSTLTLICPDDNSQAKYKPADYEGEGFSVTFR